MKIGTLAIRPARRPDLDGILGIERDSFADPWSRESFEAVLGLDRMFVLVAEHADGDEREGGSRGRRIVGFVVSLLLLDEAEIADLAVAPAARRCGVGGRLLERMIAEVAREGVRTLFLEVRESNSAARALYASQSFLPVGRRLRYYRHPVEDALLLRRELAPT
ncbi:MAG: ribosomal protein S18-alanine N-acetyltransferase [bacterium]